MQQTSRQIGFLAERLMHLAYIIHCKDIIIKENPVILFI